MKRKIKIVLLTTTLVLLVALFVEWVTSTCFPQLAFRGSWVVPLYYWLFYTAAFWFVTPSMTGAEFTRFIIGLKAAKIFISMLFAVALACLMRESVLPLVLNIIFYYLLLLVPECAYSIYMKKHIK